LRPDVFTIPRLRPFLRVSGHAAGRSALARYKRSINSLICFQFPDAFHRLKLAKSSCSNTYARKSSKHQIRSSLPAARHLGCEGHPTQVQSTRTGAHDPGRASRPASWELCRASSARFRWLGSMFMRQRPAIGHCWEPALELAVCPRINRRLTGRLGLGSPQNQC
jgi:hypothetical protein